MGQEIATLSAQAVHTHSAHTETGETCTTCICIYTHFIYNVIHIVCGSEEAEDTCTIKHTSLQCHQHFASEEADPEVVFLA